MGTVMTERGLMEFKDTTRLDKSKVIDLSKFMHVEAQDKNPKARLVAMVCHSGSMHGGHYVAFAENDDGTWWKYDCQAQNATRVRNWNPNDSTERYEGYLLFYEVSTED